MYSKILIANRGEIAVRIIRACKEMGIATVAVYSEADAQALHTALADESYCIGPASATDSYLNGERIISTALAAGCQAIHPGYGFLSENDAFAAQCAKNGIVFIGPSAANMRMLSDKAAVKARMEQARLPVIPGAAAVASVQEARAAAARIGYPVMLKASMGGGGRGIRRIDCEEDLDEAFATARAESQAAFGCSAVYLEKFIAPARHVEFQIIADEAGHVVCLGERDCSVQRNNQKLIEESPSPGITPEQRAAISQKVVRAVAQIGYVGVGTLEFLLDGDGHFYFMEMNVRLQVEHTVTESLTGIDLVKWQIRVSSGIELGFTQDDVDLRGCAIECRINACAPGRVEFLHVSGGPFVRFDTYLMTGQTVTPFYDPLLGKLIVYASTREEALRKMKAALCELVISGVDNNIAEQIALISDEAFMSGRYNLNFLKK